MNTPRVSIFLASRFLNPRYGILLLGLLVFVAYASVKELQFTNFDDPLHVTGNRHVYTGLTMENVKWAFSFGHGMWMPLSWLSHIVDGHFYETRPAGHHVTSALIHLLNTLLLFYVCRKLTGDLWPSLFVAMLFGLHPINVESVAWVTERKNVLSTFFWFLTMMAYAAYARGPSVRRYAVVLTLFLLGLLAKPMLVTLPVVFLLLDYWPLKRIGHENLLRPRAWWPLIREKVPFLLLSVAFSLRWRTATPM